MGNVSILTPRVTEIRPVLILLTSHRKDCCVVCLRCLERFTDLTRFKHIYIIANELEEEHHTIVMGFRAKHANVTVVEALPRGLVPAVNMAQTAILSGHLHDVVIKMDEDLFVTPNWLDQLLSAYQLHSHRRDIPLVSSMSPISPNGRHVLSRFLRTHYPFDRHMFTGAPVEENWVYHRWMWDKILGDRLVEGWLAERPAGAPFVYSPYATINCVVYDQRLLKRVLPFPTTAVNGLANTDEMAVNLALRNLKSRVAVVSRCVTHHFAFKSCEDYLRSYVSMEDVWSYLRRIDKPGAPRKSRLSDPAIMRPLLKALDV